MMKENENEMIIKNRLDKSFGPAGTFAGIVLFIAGIILTYFYLSGVIIILIGAFAGFTGTSAIAELDEMTHQFGLAKV